MDYRDRFRLLRIAHKLEQEDVADLCFVSQQTVSGWETHRSHMSIDSIIILCNYYKVSSDYILGLPEYPRLDKDK